MDNTRKKMTPKEAVAAAYAFVHPTVDALAEAQAAEHAYANMGQTPEDYARRCCSDWTEHTLRQFFQSAWYQLREESAYEEGVGDIDDERLGWVKQSKTDALAVAKKGLPLTVENSRKAFLGEAPFEKPRDKAAKKAVKKGKK